jgi:hypothetical protein
MNNLPPTLARMAPGAGQLLVRSLLVIAGIIAAGVLIVGGAFLAAVIGTVAAVVLSVPAVVIAVIGVLHGLRNFWQTLQAGRLHAAEAAMLRPTPPPRRLNPNPQPARQLYFYDEAWRVMLYTLRRVWTPTRTDAAAWWARARNLRQKAAALPQTWQRVPQRGAYLVLNAGVLLGSGFYFVAQILILVIGSVGQLLVNVGGMLFASLLVPLLWTVNRVNSTYFRIYYRCPHANCHAQMDVPIFLCPDCNTEHANLRPGRYGVFYHHCKGPDGQTCNYPLPTLDMLGRRSLERICPTCRRDLPNAIGRATNLHIPLVGGPSAGKSYLLAAATHELHHGEAGKQLGLTTTLPTEDHAEQVQRRIERLKQGQRLAKTSDADANVSAVTLQLRAKLKRLPQLLYLYDAAGEHYGTQDRAMQQVYYQYVGGIFLVIDPFSLPDVRERYAEQLAASPSIAPSDETPEDIYMRMLDVLRSYDAHPERVPVAVVLTKADAFDLDTHIGKAAAERLMARYPNLRQQSDALNILVQQFLLDNGATNVVLNLRNQFERVRYFSVSVVSGEQYAPQRVTAPLAWMAGVLGIVDTRSVRRQVIDRQDRSWRKRVGGGVVPGLRYYVWDSLLPPRVEVGDMVE